MSTELAVTDRNIMGLIVQLEANGALDAVSLTLTDTSMEYDRWEALGRFLGTLDRSTRWWIGDWILFGEAVFGEDAANAVESTVSERYSLAEQVTGLERQTLMNIASVCSKVAKSRRRREIGFWIHQEVAALEPAQQKHWLEVAVSEGLTKSKLRDRIRGNVPDAPPDDGDFHGGWDGLRPGERIEQAARHIFHQAERTADGGAIVPAEPWAQFAAALGED